MGNSPPPTPASSSASSTPHSTGDRALGRHNWEILREGLAGIVEVPEAWIAEAVRLLFAVAHLKAEPTGALGLAALLAEPGRFRGASVCCVVSGGNVDPEVYRRLLQQRVRANAPPI
ncbi:pyridoxal-phosphate dependent enzyme [Methylomagnum ishizawai]|uniref:pyridoxal-phosphate dependent enzyme n=1 Tax=Methylomagnum ishizawai TaxID=1760988 RepID=UPI000A14C609|nr:pyridoxal-phosphate dependent enzyme [Methylomagnum ishizawai]